MYALELPEQPKQAQEEFEIEQEGSYIIAVKNPEQPSPPGAGLSPRQKADYPSSLKQEFGTKHFIPVTSLELLDYPGAEFVLIGAEPDVSQERGVEVETEKESLESAEIVRELRLDRSKYAFDPLIRGVMK